MDLEIKGHGATEIGAIGDHRRILESAVSRRDLLLEGPVAFLSDQWEDDRARTEALTELRRGIAELLGALDVEESTVNLLADLHAIELQRITLNMQISLLHTLGRLAQECASKATEAEDAYLRRLKSIPPALRDQ